MTDRLTQLHELLETDPQDADLLYMIALEHAKAGALDEALAWLDRTLGRNAHYHYAYFQKAKLLAERGRDAEARQVLETGIQHAREANNDKAARELTELLKSLD
jgi:tetratricopeptide (TPR) repeat protein